MKEETARLIVEALEEIEAGAIRMNRQDSRITNYSLNLARKALAQYKADLAEFPENAGGEVWGPEVMEAKRAVVLAHGKPNFRGGPSFGGSYHLFSGRNRCLGFAPFPTEAAGWQWLKDQLGIEKPA